MGTRPVAQYTSSAWQYLLPDALGSVRQIADASGNISLTESYQPYGTVLNSTGSATSIFGYAGEQIDTSGLIYLRARYMSPMLGIFTSRDPWSGDQLRPGSMNGWAYGLGNPVNEVDPSGQISEAEKYYIRLLYSLYIKNITEGLNDPVLTNLSNNGFASMIAAKILVEDATFYADNWQGPWREVSDVGTLSLPGWERDLIDATLFGGEHSYGPANIPIPLAQLALNWWEQNHSRLPTTCIPLNYVSTDYYLLRDNWVYALLIEGPRDALASELVTGHGAVQATALAILESSDRARRYWSSVGERSHQLSAYTIALGVDAYSNPDSEIYPLSKWTSPGLHWDWVEAIDDAASVLGLSLQIPTDYLPYTIEEKQRLDQIR